MQVVQQRVPLQAAQGEVRRQHVPFVTARRHVGHRSPSQSSIHGTTARVYLTSDNLAWFKWRQISDFGFRISFHSTPPTHPPATKRGTECQARLGRIGGD